MNNQNGINKQNFFKITLTSLSIGATLSLNDQSQVNANSNPIINPTNPTQIIIPKVDNNNIEPIQNNNDTTIDITENDAQHEHETTVSVKKYFYNLNKIAIPYQHKIPKDTKNLHPDNNYSPVALPNYHFDIVSGGNDDLPIASSTGLIMASISGKMLMGI